MERDLLPLSPSIGNDVGDSKDLCKQQISIRREIAALPPGKTETGYFTGLWKLRGSRRIQSEQSKPVHPARSMARPGARGSSRGQHDRGLLSIGWLSGRSF